MPSRLRTFGRWLGAAAGVAVLSLAAAWFAMPPAIDPIDGPADPIIGIRGPILSIFRRLGLAPRPGTFAGPDDWLPTTGSSESLAGDSTFADARSAERTTYRFEPVYRGLLWRVGWRVSLKLETRGPDADPPNAVVLWTESEGHRVDVTRSGPAVLDAATGLRRLTVSGFLPEGFDRFGWSEVGADGRPREVESWSR